MEMTYPCGASAVGEGEIPRACSVHGVDCFRDELVGKLQDTFADAGNAVAMVARFEAAVNARHQQEIAMLTRANVTNLREMVGMAGRHRDTLRVVRERIRDLLALLPAAAPPVGVSPQLEADFQATADHIVSGIETKAESQIAWEICEALKEAASLSPVEPTPLSERHLPPAVVMLVSAASAASGYLERLQPDLAARLWAGVQAVISTPDKTVEPKPLTGAELLDRFRQVEPAPPTPAPCVWRPISQLHNEEWHRPDCTQALSESIHKVQMWPFCPYCGHPLEITR